MATFTLTLTDTNTVTGEFHVTTNVDGDELSKGFVSAALLAGGLIREKMNNPAFAQEVLDYGNRLLGDREGYVSMPPEADNDQEEAPTMKENV